MWRWLWSCLICSPLSEYPRNSHMSGMMLCIFPFICSNHKNFKLAWLRFEYPDYNNKQTLVKYLLKINKWGCSYHEVWEVVSSWVLSISEHISILFECSFESKFLNELLVVEEWDTAVHGVPGYKNHLASVQELWGKHLQGQVGLDHSRSNNVGLNDVRRDDGFRSTFNPSLVKVYLSKFEFILTLVKF